MKKRRYKKPALKVCATMCATCPFRTGSPYEYLADYLKASALTEASRICHSTGRSVIHYRTGRKSKLCRGARDLQLKLMTTLGLLAEPTDAEWDRKVKELGL